MNKFYIFIGCCFNTDKISTAGFFHSENNKRLWCHIMYCMQHRRFERNTFKTIKNSMSLRGAWNLFHFVIRTRENITILSHSWNNLQFNVSSIYMHFITSKLKDFCMMICKVTRNAKYSLLKENNLIVYFPFWRDGKYSDIFLIILICCKRISSDAKSSFFAPLPWIYFVGFVGGI